MNCSITWLLQVPLFVLFIILLMFSSPHLLARWPCYCQQNVAAEHHHQQSWSVGTGHHSTMWFIVCGWPHQHLFDDAICHLCKLAAQLPCPVRTGSAWTTPGERGQKHGGQTVESDIKVWLPMEAKRQSSRHSSVTPLGSCQTASIHGTAAVEEAWSYMPL